MKPKLETGKDIRIKAQAKTILEAKSHYQIHDLYEPLYIVDWLAVDLLSKSYIFVEFKARNYEYKKFPTLLLSLHKWMKLLSYSEYGFQAGLCIQWLDGIYYMVVDESCKKDCVYGIGGRRDRDVEGDIEPCVYIPIKRFTLVEEIR